MTTRKEIVAYVKRQIKDGVFPEYQTQDDNGLSPDEYVDLIEEALRALSPPEPTEGRRIQEIMERHAPDGFDPASDDMTIPFAIKIGELEEQLAALRAMPLQAQPEPTEGMIDAAAEEFFALETGRSWKRASGGMKTNFRNKARSALSAALRTMPLQDHGWQDISTAPDGDFLVRHRGRIRQVQLYDPPTKDIIPLNTVIDPESGRMWVATRWMRLPAMVAEDRVEKAR